MHADDQVGAGVAAELADVLRDAVDDHPVKIVPSVCEECDGRVFSVLVDDLEGAAVRVCADCGDRAYLADSEEFWEDADPSEAVCPCGGEEFESALAFSLTPDGSVRWVTLGLRCVKDRVPGVYADWKIDHKPSDHLLNLA
ncbi:hypothetical protein [Streptomyces sp. NBC_01198]|uniref:hypothetical protein n=1 Tax=Streptomyces sp. NBC_01198 TaxID=2903769 RepID=UPI002E153FAE|nr:hypothetical protein OG702_14175 [Streptomyces sp. NBC_01198]